MKLPQNKHSRSAFTLVELLVVLVILLLLVGLITAGVSKALEKAKITRNKNEIQQLSIAVENFKKKFGFYPPSRIILVKKFADYDQLRTPGPSAWNQLIDDSIQYLTRMFPRMDTTQSMEWTTDAWVPGFQLLQGDQCLVFFLGGLPDLDPGTMIIRNVLGFSSNPMNPTSPTTERIGPFFEFDSRRLVSWRPQPTLGSGGVYAYRQQSLRFPSYLDTHGSIDPGSNVIVSGAPYAYFSSYKRSGEYGRYLGAVPGPDFQSIVPGIDAGSDCATLISDQRVPNPQYPKVKGFGLLPYIDAKSGKALEPNTFQIISAGFDGKFGVGGPWAPGGGPGYMPGQDGYDDQSNFHDSTLGNE